MTAEDASSIVVMPSVNFFAARSFIGVRLPELMAAVVISWAGLFFKIMSWVYGICIFFYAQWLINKLINCKKIILSLFF